MMFSINVGRRLGLLATACLLSVALPATTAWAQKTKTKDAPAVQAAEPVAATAFTIDIPEIDAVDSNVDDDTLRAIFSGGVADNADALAGLTATSITIPTITITIGTTTTVDGDAPQSTVTFNDLVLTDVTDGNAASVALAGWSVDAGDEGTGEFGEVSAANFNIAGVLGLYGLVDGDTPSEMQTIYTDVSFAGGTFEAPDLSCSVGSMSVGELKARPLNTSFAETVSLIKSLEGQDDPSPETIGTLLRIYGDFFTAFESSPATFDGFDCSGEDEGRPMSFSIAGMTMGGMSPGIYPSIAMDGLDIAVDGDGTIKVGNLTIKEMDLSGPLAAIAAAPAALDEAWFMANARALVPAFEGFAFSDVVVDIPDPEADGERIAASIGNFDLTLGAYFNGIPTDVLTTASNILVDLPEETDDEQLQQLIDLGITSVDTGFTVDASWSEAEDTITIDELSLTGADLATVALSGTLGNAGEALFSLDENEALAAAMGVAIRSLKLDIDDAGLSDIVLARFAADQGSDPATLRPVYAGLAEGSVIGILAGAAEAQKVGAALSAFISGKAKHLTIDMTSKDAQGLGMLDFMAAEDDPTALIGKVTIDATAK
ncbi:hypothetical protein [Devosia psychrophila]|uniref:Uncharacterized protein n=1 Tax=Devosia psychrophila TaxID=728005 RepID=A0A0F5Q110_9HYPH|nr:hypothetical protein [Devosia psychrophila]KKC34336.1 hypothetical protein WH91_03505 [Devosia psychrophila]SFD24580.1 hypothetical protein SAMN04488059_13221 [Devosia psychrophila]